MLSQLFNNALLFLVCGLLTCALKMKPLSSFIVVSLLFVISYFIGVLYYLTDVRDFCDMTYMFEYPQFVKISQDIHQKFPNYGLYAYSEGKFTSKVRNMYFDGIPVLFIPGNGGSYKQVRSLSSVALRKALNSRLSYHFNFFTLDLNEEMSGIYGALLETQLNYFNNSIYNILDLYKFRKKQPKSVILIGHSMGGLLALKFISQLPVDSKLVSVAITLSAPLSKPVIMLDRRIENFYNIKAFPSSTFVVNIAGGFSDVLIPAYLSNLKSPHNNTLNLVTSNIPRCWVETDHKQIVWCKQVVLAINRALFDSVDQKTLQISTNLEYMKIVFHHHFIHNSGIKVRQKQTYLSLTSLEHKGQWIEYLHRQYSIFEMKGLLKPHSFMISITQLPNYRHLTILAINLHQQDWIYGCNAAYPRGHSRVCVEGIHLTPMSYIAPSIKFRRRGFTIDLHELKQNNSEITHVVVKTMPTDEPVILHIDQYELQRRQFVVSLPPWYSVGKQTVIEKTEEKALQYILELPELTHVVQAYILFIEPMLCFNDTYHVSASLTVPWIHHAQHGFYTDDQKRPLTIRLLNSKPQNSKSARIILLLDPSCTFRVSMKSSFSTLLSLLARYYSPLLMANTAAVLLLTFKVQLGGLRKNDQCPLFFVALKQGIKPSIILTSILGISKVLSLISFLPKLDQEHLSEVHIDFFMLPVLLYFCSIGIVWAFAVFFSISLIALESTIHKLVLMTLARTVSISLNWSDYLLSFLQKVPFLVTLVLLFICFSTCGGLALCIGLVFYFLKLTQMSYNITEDITWYVIKSLAKIIMKTLNKSKKDDTNNQQAKSDNKKSDDEQVIVSDALQQMTDNTNKPPLPNEKRIFSQQISDIDITSNIKDASGNNTKNKLCQISETHIIDNSKREDNIRKIEEFSENDKSTVIKTHDQSNLEKHSCVEDQSKVQQSQKTKAQTEKCIAHNSIFFHSTLFFIWFLVSCLNIPAILTWAHNFKSSRALIPDESFIPALILIICAFPLWQADLPKTRRKFIRHLEITTLIIAILSLLYATVSIYRLNYLLTTQVALTVLHQCFAPECDIEETFEEENKDNVNFVKVKIKLE